MKGVKHYKRDGTEFKGNTHKMPNGQLHSGKTHGKTSVRLFHFKDLSKKAKLSINQTVDGLLKILKKYPIINLDGVGKNFKKNIVLKPEIIISESFN